MNNYKNKIACLIFVSLFFLSKGYTQDFHLSQYFSSPMSINPALTGKFDGVIRATMNYRNQWPVINNAFSTTTASAEYKITEGKLPTHDAVGVGVLGTFDRIFSGILATNQFSLATAYHKGLDSQGFHHLTGSLQGTFSNKSIDYSRLLFGDQLASLMNHGVLIGTEEPFVTDAVNYLEFSAGLMYSGSTNIRNMFYAGASMYHINRPEESFSQWTLFIDRRYTVHTGGYLPISETLLMHLSGMYMQQGGSRLYIAGGALESTLSSTLSNRPVRLFTGLWWRVNDALIPYVGLTFFDFRLGISYDINLSKLRSASHYQGGIEISLFYIINPSSIKKMLEVPCGCPDF